MEIGLEKEQIKIGLAVHYYSWISEDGKTYSEPSDAVVMSDVWLCGGGEWVCKIEGISGGVDISHLRLNPRMVEVEANYSIHIHCDCPFCDKWIDIFDQISEDQDTRGQRLDDCMDGEKREVECPECKEEFECTVIY